MAHRSALQQETHKYLKEKMEPEAGGDAARSLVAGTELGEDKRARVGRRTESTEEEESETSVRGHAMLTVIWDTVAVHINPV